MQGTKLFDELLVWAITGIVGSGLWVARKVFGMNARLERLESEYSFARQRERDFEETVAHQADSIQSIRTELATMSADLRNTTKNTDRILQLLERK